MKGYKLLWGIWNFEHSITSRDTGKPETYATMQEVNNKIKEKRNWFYSIGYELWFTDIKEVDVSLCKCGKYSEIGQACWYCGKMV